MTQSMFQVTCDFLLEDSSAIQHHPSIFQHESISENEHSRQHGFKKQKRSSLVETLQNQHCQSRQTTPYGIRCTANHVYTNNIADSRITTTGPFHMRQQFLCLLASTSRLVLSTLRFVKTQTLDSLFAKASPPFYDIDQSY